MKIRFSIWIFVCAILLSESYYVSFGKPNKPPVQYQFTTITALGKNTAAYGINQRGYVVGYFVSSTGYASQADLGFIQDKDSTKTITGPNNANTYAAGINRSGQIVGWCNNSSADHGFVVTNDVLTIFDFPEAATTVARGYQRSRPDRRLL
jgi:uncharacterized membrane protein